MRNYPFFRSTGRAGFWLLWLVPVLIAWLFWLLGGAVAVDVGGGTDDVVVGERFHAAEQNASDSYRWSRDESLLRLPAHVLPAVLQLRGAVAPDGTRVTLHLGQHADVALPPHTGPPEMRRYLLLWPDDGSVQGWADLGITAQIADEASARAEQRAIGMLVADVQVQSVAAPQQWVALPWLLLLVFGLLPLLLAGLLRLSGIAMWPAALLSLGAGVALVLLWGWWPLWVQPFVFNSLFIVLALLGAVWWMRQVAQRHNPPGLPWLLVVLVAVSGIIPLYMLLKYGFHIEPDPTKPLALRLFEAVAPNLPTVAMLAALPLPFVGRRLRVLLAGIVIATLAVYGGDLFVRSILKDYATDFTALFRGVRSFVNGEQLYNLENINFNHLGDTYKYPPFFVFLMAPIANTPYIQAILIWHLFNFGLLLLAALLLWRWSGRPVLAWSTLGLGYMVLNFKPVVDTLSSGQADILMLVSLSAALLALGAGRWAWWGALLAFPAAVKLYAGYLLIHSAALRQWRAIAAFGVAFGLLNGLALLVLGWQVHATFLFEVLPNIGGGTAWVENQTINGFLNRFVVDRIGLIPGESLVVRLLTYAAALLFTGLTFWRVQGMTPAAGFGLWIVTLLIILPIAWMHYAAILVIPFYQLFVRLEQPEQAARPGWRSLLLYGLAWMLLCYGNQWTFFDRTMYEGPFWLLLLSYKLYGLLCLWFALAFDPTAQTRPLAERQPEQARQPSPVMQT